MQIAAPPSNAKSWRDVLPIHPAAELFPMMSEPELKELGQDIKKNGLKMSIAIFSTKTGEGRRYWLLDGRNRLAAMEAAGLAPRLALDKRGQWILTLQGVDVDDVPQPVDAVGEPYAFVISTNIHRRHLTGEQKRELIGKLLKATPEKSNRQIAETVKVSPTTVGTVRAEMEATGMVSKLDTRTDARGVEQPAHKPKHEHPESKPVARGGIVTGVATHAHAERGFDLYETPEPAVRALLTVEWFNGPIWEPACGPGAIVRVMRGTGHKVVATDIEDDAYGCPWDQEHHGPIELHRISWEPAADDASPAAVPVDADLDIPKFLRRRPA
jgi:hypothetical protein